MAIFPPLNQIQTDFGPEFSQIWTVLCAKYGVSHINEIPKHSQNNGGAEISIKLLKQGLGRMCAGQENGRKNWPDMLPKLIQTAIFHIEASFHELSFFSVPFIMLLGLM